MSSSKKKRSSAARAVRRVQADGAAGSSSIAAAAPTVSKVTAAAAAAAASPSPLESPAASSAGGHPRGPFGERLLFVTVGTTRFDALVESMNRDADALVQWLADEGFSEVQLQIGTGTVEPATLRRAAEEWSASPAAVAAGRSLRVSWFGLSPDLLSLVSRASLVVSHAGAGSILEALRRGRPLLVVINDKLMHNHQTEVADALVEGHYLYQTTPEQLLHTLRAGDWSAPAELPPQSGGSAAASASRYRLRRYPPMESDAFPRLLEQHVAEALRPPPGSRAALLPALLTTVVPAAVALAITWAVFA